MSLKKVMLLIVMIMTVEVLEKSDEQDDNRDVWER